MCTYRRSGPEAQRLVPHSCRRAPPATDFCRICKKRCEERRGEILAWGQGDAGGRGEGNHLMRRRSWLQEHRREKQVGGGDPGGGGVLLAESHDSRARRGRGSAARCLEAEPASMGKLGLPEPKKPHAQGFQKCMMGFAWKNSARAAGPGK